MQALLPACSTAMGLGRRAERSSRDGGGSPSIPQPHRSAGCVPAAPQRRCASHPSPPPAERFLSQLLPSFHGNPAAPSPLAAMHWGGGAELQTPTAVLWVLGSRASPTCSSGPAAPSHSPTPTLHPPYPHLQRAEQSFGTLPAVGDAVEPAVRGWGWDVGVLALCCRAVGCVRLQPPPAAWGGGTAQPAGRVSSDSLLNQERSAAHPPLFPFP